jgi:hypothetical protein
MMTAIEPPTLPRSYAGVPIHARGFALAAVYDSSWSPPDDGDWTDSEHIIDVWHHRRFPRHVVWKPESARVVITELAQGTPRPIAAAELARLALGPGATPARVVSYPISLRLPMRGPGSLVIPSEPHRCRRVWPPPNESAHLESVDGVPVEFRIDSSTGSTDDRIYAAAFVGRAHANDNGEPRAMIFAADARHALLAPSALEVRAFTAHLMDRLFMFACNRHDQGVTLDHRRLTGRRLGRSRPDSQGSDIEFEIRLPQPGRTLRYVGDYFTGYEGPAV